MSVQQELQKPVIGKYVELFVLDLTALGGPVFRFTPNTVGGASSVSFGGQVYTALPIAGEGWQTSVDGQAPQPTLSVSNAAKFMQSYVAQYNNLLGAKVTRLQTLDKYLDTGSTPDSTQVFNSSVYLVEQKLTHNHTQLQFKLVSVIDAPQFKLPKGQVTRAIFPGAGLFRKQ